jgi:hypothetical protein
MSQLWKFQVITQIAPKSVIIDNELEVVDQQVYRIESYRNEDEPKYIHTSTFSDYGKAVSQSHSMRRRSMSDWTPRNNQHWFVNFMRDGIETTKA